MEKICPLMSTADKQISCNENCEWYDPQGQIARRCAIFSLIDSIDYLENHSCGKCSEYNEE